MAKFNDFNTDEIEKSLLYQTEKAKRLVPKMLEVGAAIMEKAQKEKARQYGVEDTGKVINSITASPVKKAGNKMTVIVAPKGDHGKGIRNAYIAFVNEYGIKSKAIIPRNFMRDAKAESKEKIREEMLRIWEGG